MNKRRRIEITAFHRRTTITVRNQPAGGHAAPPPCPVAASHAAIPDSAKSAEGDLDREAVEHLRYSLVSTKSKDEKPSKGE